ncbi:MAG: hypothetical protein ACTSU5_14275 [Promethearchaeota archaeon]
MAVEQLKPKVDALLGGYKRKIVDFFNGFQTSANKKLEDYISKFNVGEESEILTVVHFPVDPGRGKYTPVPASVNIHTKIEIRFMGLAFQALEVEVVVPGVLVGPASRVPRIVFRAKTPRSWPGHYGLYFDPENPHLTGWYPYERKTTRRRDVRRNMEEEIVDAMCDFLNKGIGPPAIKLRENLRKIYGKKILPAFYYQSQTDKNRHDKIAVPIYVEYDEQADESTMVMQTFASKDFWMQPQTVALSFFDHLAEATNYFDDEGELFEDGPHPPEWSISQKGQLERKRTVKKAKADLDENPFQTVEKVERDAFGFVIKRADGDFALDVEDAETRRMEEQKRKMEEREKAASEASSKIVVDVSMYRDAMDWYNQNMTRQFTLAGVPETLNFRDRGDYTLLLSMNPPFILQFIRDQVKIKKGLLTTRKAAEWLFECHKKGFLVPL